MRISTTTQRAGDEPGTSGPTPEMEGHRTREEGGTTRVVPPSGGCLKDDLGPSRRAPASWPSRGRRCCSFPCKDRSRGSSKPRPYRESWRKPAPALRCASWNVPPNRHPAMGCFRLTKRHSRARSASGQMSFQASSHPAKVALGRPWPRPGTVSRGTARTACTQAATCPVGRLPSPVHRSTTSPWAVDRRRTAWRGLYGLAARCRRVTNPAPWTPGRHRP